MRSLSFADIFINIVIIYIYAYDILSSPSKKFDLLFSYDNLKKTSEIMYLKLIS